MKQIILRSIPSLCNDNITQSIAARFAERHANVIAALQRIVPTILRGFADRAKEGPEVAHGLLQLAGGEAVINSWWQNPVNGISDANTLQKGHEMLQQLFGLYDIDVIAKQIAVKTMIRSSTAVKLMQWVAPFCFGAIIKVMIEKKYDAAMLCASLSEESFDLTNETIGNKAYYNSLPYAASAKKRIKDFSWVHFLLLVACGGLLYWILNT